MSSFKPKVTIQMIRARYAAMTDDMLVKKMDEARAIYKEIEEEAAQASQVVWNNVWFGFYVDSSMMILEAMKRQDAGRLKCTIPMCAPSWPGRKLVKPPKDQEPKEPTNDHG